MPIVRTRVERWATVLFSDLGFFSRYGLAVLAVAAAVGARLVLKQVVGVYAPHVPFTIAVAFAALWGGRGPGLAAVALSTLTQIWFFTAPVYTLLFTDPAEAWAQLLFLVGATIVALLVGSLRESLIARARTEEALHRQAQLLDLSHDAIITMDTDRRILTWNNGAEEIYGWPEREAVGQVLHRLLQTSCPASLQQVAETLRLEGRWEGEMCQTARDGRRLVVDSRQVLLDCSGGLPECILAINRDITERKRADDALRISEARLQFVLQAASLGAFDYDLTSSVLWRSQQHDAIFGYPALLPEWNYQIFLDHVLPEDREEVTREFTQGVTAGADLALEFRIRCPDGAVRWVAVLGKVQADPYGKPLRVTGILQDITDRKKMEEELRQNEEQFRTLANAIPQLCGMANPDGTFFWVNRRFCDYTGLSLKQARGWGWISALHAKASSKALDSWRHSISTGEAFEAVLAVRGADAIVRPFLARAVPVRDRHGAISRWFGTMTDISEQRRIEEALRKAHDEQLARATELQAIMDAVPVAMFISRDRECRHVLGNQSCYQLLGEPPGSNLSKEPPEGKHAADFRVFAEGKELTPHELPLQRAAATGEPVHDHEFELARADGSRCSILGNAVPLLDSDGHSNGAIGVFLDITERKQTEGRLRQAQKLESIGLLAGGIAHDFNNLLTVIMGSADFALRKCPACPEMRNVVTSSERAAYLTRQLLAYAGKGQFISETFNLSDLVSRRTEVLSAAVPKRVELEFHLPSEELLIKADPAQIEQILVNLVTNAGEAIPPDADGRIDISTSICEVPLEVVRAHAPAYDARPGQYICLEVLDNGSGMDEATQGRIFDPFFSTRFTGRGLGLAAVQGVVRSCGGFIDVQSSPGAGSKFRVFLPAARKISELPVLSGPTGVPRRPALKSAVILVVEDEEMMRELVCGTLKGHGYEVLEAKDGKEALEILAVALPSLILLDMTLPAMGAEELVPILNRLYPDLPIIVTSSYTEDDALKAFPPGSVAGFLEKPYTLTTLTDKVEQTLKSGGGPMKTSPAAA